MAEDPAAEGDPTALVRRLLAAFEQGDAGRAAAALLRVADASMAGRLGGEAHLVHVLGNPAWAPLLGHRASRLGPVQRIDRAARVRLEVDTPSGARVGYLASLRRTEPDGPWRLTGLVREELADA